MKIAVAEPGNRYVEGSIDLQWPRGGGKRDVVTVDDDPATWPAGMKTRFDAGYLVAVKKAESSSPAAPVAGLSFKELQAEAKALGIKSVGVKRADLEAAIAAAHNKPTA